MRYRQSWFISLESVQTSVQGNASRFECATGNDIAGEARERSVTAAGKMHDLSCQNNGTVTLGKPHSVSM